MLCLFVGPQVISMLCVRAYSCFSCVMTLQITWDGGRLYAAGLTTIVTSGVTIKSGTMSPEAIVN